MGEIKEIKKQITKEEYEELTSLPSAFDFRESVKKTVKKEDLPFWFGVRVSVEEDGYFLYHTVSKEYEGSL